MTRPRLPRPTFPQFGRKGSVALVFALMLVPLLLAVGAAVDFGRVYVSTKTLQGVVDQAALAGATVFIDSTKESLARSTASRYYTAGLAALPGSISAGPATITTTTTTNCDADSAERITVSATATITHTLMSLASPSTSVTVTATAANPQAKFVLDLVKFDFSGGAGDWDSLYWYKVPDDGSVPAASALNKIIDNMSASAPMTITACISSSQKIGFAFGVVPAGKFAYYHTYNTYGGLVGHQYYYYSTSFPPSKQAYPYWPYDSTLQIVDVASDGSYPAPTKSTYPSTCNATTMNADDLARCQANVPACDPAKMVYNPEAIPKCLGNFPANAEPLGSIATQGYVSCNMLDGRAIHLYWNDMGPSDDPVTVPQYSYDDLNYTDAEITFSCATTENKSVYLER